MKDKIIFALGIFALLLLTRNIYVITDLPPEANQGAIFKIIFFHATMAMTALTGSFVAFAASALFLITRNFFWDALAVAVTEVGLAFLAANLITGSLWGRIIWGIWWTWDARLTSALSAGSSTPATSCCAALSKSPRSAPPSPLSSTSSPSSTSPSSSSHHLVAHPAPAARLLGRRQLPSRLEGRLLL